MTRNEIVDHLRSLSNADRLFVIEVASKLLREDLARESTLRDSIPSSGDDPILRVAGTLEGKCPTSREIDSSVYGP